MKKWTRTALVLGIGLALGAAAMFLLVRRDDLPQRGEVRQREVCVAERHRKRLVPQQLLDRAQVHARHGKPAGEGVAQVVPAEVFEPDMPDGGDEHPVQEVGDVHRRDARLAREHPITLTPAGQRAQDREGGVVQLSMAGSAVLRAGDGEDPVNQIDIQPAEAELLALAERY